MRFDAWLKKRAKSVSDAVTAQLGATAIELFKTIADKMDGEVAPGDYADVGFKSVQAMRPHVRDLEAMGLLEAQRDDVDQRRKSISVTGKGWLVRWSQLAH
jgi:hypothetical protein